jgi:ABC-type transport system involved in multi-copper enzyme maturation permease subunit
MALRISPGPVFYYESLILARRRQVYAGRALFVFAVLIGLTTAWYGTGGGSPPPNQIGGPRPTLQLLALAGEKFFYAMAAIQLVMVLLVSPVAAAGAICQDRAKGIFAQLAATDLSDTEIVLGKLGSRLAPILGVLFCGLPVSALAALLGGIDPFALASLFAVSVAVAVLGCSLALAISVGASKTHDVIITVAALWILWVVSLPAWSGLSTISGVVPPPDWFKKANPFLVVYAPYVWPGFVILQDVATFVAALLLISAALMAATIATVRGRVLEPARRVRGLSIVERLGVSRWLAWMPGPTLDGNPVLWREWRRSRPSRIARTIWLTYVVGSLAGAGTGIHEAIVYGPGTSNGIIILNTVLLLQFVLGLMIVGSLAPASLAEERARGSLDVLLTTPLSAHSILEGKWLGTYRVVLWLTLLPGLTTAILSYLAAHGPPRATVAGPFAPALKPLGLVECMTAPALIVLQMLTYGAAITSVGLALATWISRLGRAIAVNMVIFVLITIGWPVFFEAVIWYPLREWLRTDLNMVNLDLRWLVSSMMAISPFAAPIVTLQGLLEYDWDTRGTVWSFVAGWCVLSSAIAVAMFWTAVATFDRCLGRMPERGMWD